MLKIMGKKIFTILGWKFCLSKPMINGMFVFQGYIYNGERRSESV